MSELRCVNTSSGSNVIMRTKSMYVMSGHFDIYLSRLAQSVERQTLITRVSEIFSEFI